MRIATWNVERVKPNGWKIAPAQRRRIAEVDADIWVLTETHLAHSPSPAHTHSAFSPPFAERRHPDERWAAIWSRWPLEIVDDPAPHRRGTVAAIVDAPSGPVIVYGTVIPWANERTFDDGSPAKMWDVHVAEIERQGAEWRRLRERFQALPLVIAGDFNQDRDGSGWYGTERARATLTAALAAADLQVATDRDAVAEGMLRRHHLVDHICIEGNLIRRTDLHCWESEDDAGQRLSDHPTVAIDIDR